MILTNVTQLGPNMEARQLLEILKGVCNSTPKSVDVKVLSPEGLPVEFKLVIDNESVLIEIAEKNE